jgi:hypothetical protein
MTYDKYNDTTKGINYSDGRVSAPIIIDCWLEEGAVTVNSASTIQYKGRMLGLPSQSFAAALTVGSKVQLAPTDSAYTFAALEGKPIVSAVAATGGVIGELVTYPTEMIHTPSSSAAADTIAERVAGKFYRQASVKIYAMEYSPCIVNNTTAVAVADHLEYVVDESGWRKETSTTVSPVIACHVATASGQYTGGLFLGGLVPSSLAS